MIINESINLSATLIVTNDNNEEIPTVVVRSKLEEGGSSLTFTLNVINETELINNAENIQTQLYEFMNAIRTKMAELNYKLTI